MYRMSVKFANCFSTFKKNNVTPFERHNLDPAAKSKCAVAWASLMDIIDMLGSLYQPWNWYGSRLQRHLVFSEHFQKLSNLEHSIFSKLKYLYSHFRWTYKNHDPIVYFDESLEVNFIILMAKPVLLIGWSFDMLIMGQYVIISKSSVNQHIIIIQFIQ